MRTLLGRYARWLHTGWPAGTVEPFPEVREDGSTAVPGVYVAGDLLGAPLLKLAAHSGARAVRTIAADPNFRSGRRTRDPQVRELAIVGAGVSGTAAALEARKLGIDYVVFECRRPFQTIADFPARKPIFLYPFGMTPDAELRPSAVVKEDLLEQLERAADGVDPDPRAVASVAGRDGRIEVRLADGTVVPALRAIVAIGRSGNYRKLGVPGENLAHVHHRLYDPADHASRRALVIGGGDSAVETAVALAEAGADVVLSYRGDRLVRPKPANLERLERLSDRVELRLASEIVEIRAYDAVLRNADGAATAVPIDVVFAMTGREAPLEFFRRSGIRIAGERSAAAWVAVALTLGAFLALYDWKSGGLLDAWSRAAGAFPYSLSALEARLPERSLSWIVARSAQSPSFWYTLAYSAVMLAFGVRRVRRRPTPYVRAQTAVLVAIQIVPLFLLPEILLPWFDYRGWLPAAFADALFPSVDYGHGREFWRAYGLILAWPLNVYNVFTETPLPWWLAICFVQTFVLIPAAVFTFGKGAYCGWICSCGGMAETLGDLHRHKMPHGPRWNRLNLAGQALLAIAFALLGVRIALWIRPDLPVLGEFWNAAFTGSALSWKWTVDVLLAGAIGYGLYFFFSGRVWCRFFCPLAALMHVYARFGRFRILADKDRCISCNVCTAVCHQGIDVMAFANRGLPMADPQCVRCSACVEMCPTAVLRFGQIDRAGRAIRTDRLRATRLQS